MSAGIALVFTLTNLGLALLEATVFAALSGFTLGAFVYRERSLTYSLEKNQLTEHLNSMVQREGFDPAARIDDIELMRSERLNTLRGEYIQNMILAAALLAVGGAFPLLASRYLINNIKNNLELLDERLASNDITSSALMAQAFDLKEFDKVLETLREVLRERSETQASVSSGSNSRTFSSPFHRAMLRQHVNTGAQAWGWPYASACLRPWAERSGRPVSPVKALVFIPA